MLEYRVPDRLPLPSLVTRINQLINVPPSPDGSRPVMAVLCDGQSNAGFNADPYDWSDDLQSNFKEWNGGGSFTVPGTAFVDPDTTKINFPRARWNLVAKLFPHIDWRLVTISRSGLPVDHWTRGVKYKLDSTVTTSADPGSGYIRLNNANPALATEAYVNERDLNGHLRTAALNVNTSSLPTGPIRIEKESDPTVYYAFTAGTPTLNATWRIIPLTYVGKNGTISDEDPVRIKTGDDMRAIEDANIPSALDALGKDHFDFVDRWQGETDSAYGRTYYLEDSEEWFQRWKDNGWILDDTPITIMGVTSGAVGGSSSYDNINLTLQQVVGIDPDHRTFVNSSSVSASLWSTLHPLAEGYLRIGHLATLSTFFGWGRPLHQGALSDLVTGQAVLPDGTAALPSFGYLSNRGVGPRYRAGGFAYFGSDTTPGMWFSPGSLQINSEGGSAVIAVNGESNTELNLTRYSASTASPIIRASSARGTIATPSPVLQNDLLLFLDARGLGNSAFVTAARYKVTTKEATPSDAAMGAYGVFQYAKTGANTLSDALGIDPDLGLSFGGIANFFLNGSRWFFRRQYAAGSLPSQAAGYEIASSDVVGAPLVSDGTQWTTPGVKVLNAVTANTTISIPAGWAISAIHFANTTANAVTGGVKIGTTSGATDVVAAQAVGGNAIGTILDADVLKRLFSRASAQTLYVQAVTGWNSASVEFSFVLRKVF